jgi:hypothetical protein
MNLVNAVNSGGCAPASSLTIKFYTGYVHTEKNYHEIVVCKNMSIYNFPFVMKYFFKQIINELKN